MLLKSLQKPLRGYNKNAVKCFKNMYSSLRAHKIMSTIIRLDTKDFVEKIMSFQTLLRAFINANSRMATIM